MDDTRPHTPLGQTIFACLLDVVRSGVGQIKHKAVTTIRQEAARYWLSILALCGGLLLSLLGAMALVAALWLVLAPHQRIILLVCTGMIGLITGLILLLAAWLRIGARNSF